MKLHEYALLFPRMEADQFAALVADIKEHGLLDPITLYEGKVLDGRHRSEACDKLKITPKSTTFKGSHEAAYHFVIAKNLKRRHLTKEQVYDLVAKLLPIEEELARERLKEAGEKAGRNRVAPSGARLSNAGKAASAVAKQVGISERTVERIEQDIKRVEANPSARKAVLEGKKSLMEAAADLREKARRKKVEEEDAADQAKEPVNPDRDPEFDAWIKREVKKMRARAKLFDTETIPTEVKPWLTLLLKVGRQLLNEKKFSPEAARFAATRLTEMAAEFEAVGKV